MRRAFDWMFLSRIDGRIVIGQFPNLSLWVFIAARAIGAFLDGGTPLAKSVDVIAALALVWWAADELVRGVNPWRRLLGGSILAVQLLAVVR